MSWAGDMFGIGANATGSWQNLIQSKIHHTAKGAWKKHQGNSSGDEGGRWVQKSYTKYRKTREIPSLKKPGKPKAVITDRMRKMVLICVEQYQIGVVGIEKELDRWGIHMPHNTIHRIMRVRAGYQSAKKSHVGANRYDTSVLTQTRCGMPTINC